jgi:hypothetical protein
VLGCLAAASSCGSPGLTIRCDQDTDCAQGSICCFARERSSIECLAEDDCVIDDIVVDPGGFNPEQVPRFSPLCGSPVGGGRADACAASQRQCEAIPNAPAGWASCARPL